MGKQILIIGMAGTFKAGLASEIVKQLSSSGLQVHHASIRYDGQVHFATGGPDDLKESLREYAVPDAAMNTPQSVTLNTINENVLEVKAILKRFEAYEKKSDKEKGPKEPKGAKKGAGEISTPPANAPAPEGHPAPQPENTAPTGDAPAAETPPSEGAAGDAAAGDVTEKAEGTSET